ncbi:hypothetical protein Bca52824_047255 [Brassica carinata]|uniref:Uncharacterized protein n=1 Tax=Brassica carinata TaxID=52824 RepID=A0A8X7RG02_BRACI|nr:hypothetical protein Bca52824_047255 [Brassica carinata]
MAKGDGFSDRNRSSLPSSSPLLQRRSSSASRRHHLRRHSAPLLRLLGSSQSFFAIISTSPASVILGEVGASSPPPLRSVAAVIKGIRHPPEARIGDFAYFGCKGIVSVFGMTMEVKRCIPVGVSCRFEQNASFISIEEDLQFEDLMKIVSEDFKEEVIGLSYGMSLTSKALLKVNADSASCNNQASIHLLHCFLPPERNTVHTDPTSRNVQTSDTFASHVPLNAIPVFCSITAEKNRQPAKQIPLLPKSKLLEEIIKAKGKFDFTAELEKLKEELMEADGMLADVKVKVPDWCKLEEKWLLDE